MDCGPSDSISLPILTPLFGFSTLSAPEITAETRDINDGTALFTRKVIKHASIGNITLTQGVSFANNDFQRWMEMAIVGDTAIPDLLGLLPIGGPTYRRNLLLIQYFARPNLSGALGAVGAGATALVGMLGALGGGASAASVAVGTGLNVAATSAGVLKVGPFAFAARIPARAWMLRDVIPVRYKSGSDFDASSGAISVAELELALEMLDEYSLGSGLAYGVPGAESLTSLFAQAGS